jgi:hypothetical protein
VVVLRKLLCAVACFASPSLLLAQAPASGVTIHGFGSWAFGKTGANVFLAGTPEGDFRHVSMALDFGAKVDEKLSIHTQIEVKENEDGSHPALSYAFAEYAVSDALTILVGQVKHPFGIYTEVSSVGTLRPFLDLPQGFYGPSGFAGESYKGLGISGTAAVRDWTLDYDVYGGGTDQTRFVVPERYFRGGDLQNVAQENELQSTRNVAGGRLVVSAPVTGLRFGASAYTGTLNEPASNRRTVFAGQIGYRSNAWTLESEVAREVQQNDERATGGYVLAAYRLTPEWQIAVQADRLRSTLAGVDPSSAPSLQTHEEGAFAVSYWVSRSLVVKAEYHHVNGNRFALPHPEDLLSVIAANQLRTRTHLFQFGGQFSF